MDGAGKPWGYFSYDADPEQRRGAGHDDQTERNAEARPLGARDVQRVGGVRHSQLLTPAERPLVIPLSYRVESQQFTLLHKVSHYGASEINKAENQQRGHCRL